MTACAYGDEGHTSDAARLACFYCNPPLCDPDDEEAELCPDCDGIGKAGPGQGDRSGFPCAWCDAWCDGRGKR
jgi:hypothetical protein